MNSYDFKVLIEASLDSYNVIHHFMNVDIRKENMKSKKIIYELLYFLGEGSYGIVHFAKINLKKEKIAIKITKKSIPINYDEIINYIKLSGEPFYEKYLPKLYHIFEKGPYYYIVMEYIEGVHLDHKFFQEKIKNIEDFTLVLKRLLKIFKFFHKKGLVINDVKPENILINNALKPRLIDVGLITDVHDEKQIFKGTPLFFPPESFNNTFSNYKKDIWMLAAIIIKMVDKEYLLKKCIVAKGLRYKFNTLKLKSILNDVKYLFFKNSASKFGSEDNTIDPLIKIWNILSRCFRIDFQKRPSANRILHNELFNDNHFNDNHFNDNHLHNNH